MLSPKAKPTPAVRPILWGVVLGGAVLLVYLRSLGGRFLWDDDLHVYLNPRIIGPQGLKEIWTTAAANYFPLVLTNFWVQHALWGLQPFGYHAVTIGCHAFCALLLWRVLLALRVPGAWLGAALWALHPVQVESVAWISELKNTQSGVFFLLSILFFIRWLDRDPDCSPARERRDARPLVGPCAHAQGYTGIRSHEYFLALLFGLFALLSKPSTVMLPVALVLCAWWRRGEFRLRHFIAAAPLFAAAAAASAWAIWEQRVHSGALGADWNQTPLERAVIAGRATWFYLGKLAWPHALAFIYPRWDPTPTARSLLPFAAAVIGLFLLGWNRGRWRAAFFASAYFVALLFPVLGFFSVYFFRYSFVGDHFQYLASMGPLALAGAAIAVIAEKTSPKLVAGIAGLWLATLAALTFRIVPNYSNNVALWSATLRVNPGAAMPWLNLADSLSKDGRHPEAIDAFHHALAVKPDDPDGHADLGCELVLVGRPAQALPEFERALQLRPKNPETHNNLGNALWYLGRHTEAVAEYRRALELKPDYGEAENNLGAALAELGRPDEALPLIQAALRANPKHVEAYDNYGNVLRVLGKVPEAIAAHQQALQLRPKFAQAEYNLANDFVAAGKPDEAIVHFRRATGLQPDFAAAAGGLARVLAGTGRSDEARRELGSAVQAAPNSPIAHNNLGSFLAGAGERLAAIREFAQAVRLDPRWPVARTNLATVLAAAGRWDDAVTQFEAAAKLLPDSADAHAKLAVAMVNAGRTEAAIPSFTRALSLNPNSADLRDQFAQVLKALGRDREALEQMDEAARLRR